MRGKPITRRLQEIGRRLEGIKTEEPGSAVNELVDEIADLVDLVDIVLTHELNIADLERAVFGLDQSSRPTMDNVSDPAFKALGDNPAERIVRQGGAVADELDAQAVMAEQEEARLLD